jgi:hypothetical protein
MSDNLLFIRAPNQHCLECCDAQSAAASGQKQSPTFATATAELASTPDAKAHNRYKSFRLMQ